MSSIVGVFTKSQPSIGGYVFDAILSEVTDMTTVVTEFPIESGSIGNDHAVQKPMKIIMTVGVSDNVFRAAAAAAGNFSSLASAGLGVAVGASVSQINELAVSAGLSLSLLNASYAAGQSSTRSQSALEAIRELQRANVFIDVVGPKREYSNCLITNTHQEINKENEQGLELVVEMQENLIINSTPFKAPIPAPNDTAETQAQNETNFGQLVLR